jgi:DDE superfamily endonuclease
MDESIVLKWVDMVLKPYVATAPVGIEPILFLDSYRCHVMQSVVTVIQGLGVEVKHIPGGCTGLCQPIDVGIGQPLKAAFATCGKTGWSCRILVLEQILPRGQKQLAPQAF